MLDSQPAEDLKLTIYFISPQIFTRIPLDKDDLMEFDGVTKIVINANELAENWEYIQNKDISTVQPTTEEAHVNARVYYVFETNDDKILEVVLNGIQDFDRAFINGLPVKNHPVLYEVLLPFLTEDDRNILGIT